MPLSGIVGSTWKIFDNSPTVEVHFYLRNNNVSFLKPFTPFPSCIFYIEAEFCGPKEEG